MASHIVEGRPVLAEICMIVVGPLTLGRLMTPASPKEFREYADKCIRWAGTAKTEHERDFFLKIARTWLDAALRV